MSVTLPPDLLGTAETLVATGRYADVEAVMRSALTLLRTQEDRRSALIQSIEEARREAEEHGYLELDEALAAMDLIIAEEEARQVAR